MLSIIFSFELDFSCIKMISKKRGKRKELAVI